MSKSVSDKELNNFCRLYLDRLSTGGRINESRAAVRMSQWWEVADATLHQALHVHTGWMLQHLCQCCLDAVLCSSGTSHQSCRRRGTVLCQTRWWAVWWSKQHVNVRTTEAKRVDPDVAAVPGYALIHDLPIITTHSQIHTASFAVFKLHARFTHSVLH